MEAAGARSWRLKRKGDDKELRSETRGSNVKVEVLKRGSGSQGLRRRSVAWKRMKDGQPNGQWSLQEDRCWGMKEDRRTRWQNKAKDKEKRRWRRWRTRSRVPVQCCCSPSGLPIRTLSSKNTPGSAMWVTPLPLLLPSIHPLPPPSCFPSICLSISTEACTPVWQLVDGGCGVERGDNGEQDRAGTEVAVRIHFRCFLESSKRVWFEQKNAPELLSQWATVVWQ